ncbi:MAG: transcriptional regulator, GntR family with aminotransferase domain protein [Marmoricola sp.]|nr:transcriptional regulator, GntR family with aminotransferase domain protein [Marmoricola sp.]
MTVLAAARVATLVGAFDRSPAYLGLAEALRMLIAEGRVPVGARLPSERDLTTALGVSRTTVTRAYAVLREERYLDSQLGSGSVTRLPVSRLGRTDHLLIPRGSDEDSIDLTIATPAAPPGTAAAYERAVSQLPAYLSGTGYYPTGLPALREALAARYAVRGLATDPSQIVIVAGALAGVAVAAQALIGPGDRVLVETPTYPNPITTLRARHARLLTTAVDPEHGWDVEHLGRLATQAKAAYLIPDFHNPTGALMSSATRIEVAAALGDTVPIVDESMVDLALDDDPMPEPFAVHSRDAITVGSSSKAFWGGLRIGWMRVPTSRVAAVTAARMSLDLSSPPVEQLVLLEMLADEATIREHHRSTLLASRAALLTAIAGRLPSWEVAPGGGGLALWCRLPEPLSSTLSVTAERQGVYLAAGPSFAPEGGLEHRVRIPYTQRPDVLIEAVRRIALAWDEAIAEDRRTTRTGRIPVVA